MTTDMQIQRIAQHIRAKVMLAMSNVTEENKYLLTEPDLHDEWDDYLIRCLRLARRLNPNDDSIFIPEPRTDLAP